MFGLVRTMLHSLEKKREGGSGGEQRERDACVACMWFYMVRGMKDEREKNIFKI